MNEGTEKNVGDIALKAGIWYVISSVLVKAIVVITTPLFTRIMSVEEFGTVATFTSWYSMLLVFCTLNLNYSIGRAKLDFPGCLNDYIATIQLVSAGVVGLLFVGVLFFLEPIADLLELSPLMVILLMIYLLFSPAINFAQNGYRYRYLYKQNIAIAWYIAISSTMMSVVLILVMEEKKDLYRIIGTVLPVIILSLYFWIRQFKEKRLRVNKRYFKYGIKLSVPLILHTVSLNILAQSDRIFITKIWGASYTAIYSLAYSYGMLISIVTNAVADGWLPWFHDTYYAGEFDKIKKNVKLVVLLGCYIGLACIALAPEAIMILGGSRYREGIYCVPPIVLGVVCQYIYTQYVNIELHLKKTQYVSIGTACAAVLNIILNIIFIPIWGFVAAAYTTLAGYIVLLFLHYIITKRILKVVIYDNLFMFGSACITSLIAFVLMFSYQYTVLRYGLIVIGLMSFLFVFKSYMLIILKGLKKGG